MISLSELQSVAEQAARAAGKVLSGARQQDAGILSAKGKDIKTQADQDAEAAILNVLAPTGIPILAEESGLQSPDASRTVQEQLERPEGLWIVDPLDGTYNYTRGMPWTGVSVAYWEEGGPALGVIYDFNTDEMWTGSSEHPACCNGQPVTVSDIDDRRQAVLCTGFPSARDLSDDALRSMFEDIQSFKKIRMIGSAVIAMVFVARGWADAYREESSWIWDIAAGAAIVKAAGGDVRLSNVKPNGQLDIEATNGRL